MSEKYELKTNIPENLGIPSEAILNFIEHLERRKLCIHSFLIMRHGEIAAEGYYPPFKADTLHRMYSQSKTFVSVAIGMLIDEGKLKLSDKVADFFPEYQPENMHPFIAEATVRDLLMMAQPYEWTTYGMNDENWVWTFLNRKPLQKSGTVFMYNTGSTVMLNGIVEKLSGKNLIDYMRPKLLDPLGFSKDAWCIERPEGGAWGGSGVMCSTHDMAKFALMLLDKGKCRHSGEQLVSEEYIIQATSAQIDNRVSTDSPELQFGYGYQIWRTRNNGFAMVGMGSQLSVCVPDKDLVFIITADTQIVPQANDMILDIFWTEVYPYIYINEDNLSENKNNKSAYDKLQNKLNNLMFLPVEGKRTSHKSHELFSGKKYVLDKNPMNMSDVHFTLEKNDTGVMKYTNSTGSHEIRFGVCKYEDEVREFPETYYFGRKIGVPKGSGYKYKASGAWFDDETLIIYLYVIDDYVGTLKINAKFNENENGTLTLFMRKSAEWFLDEYEGIATGIQEYRNN